jgi:hypothetical protein
MAEDGDVQVTRAQSSASGPTPSPHELRLAAARTRAEISEVIATIQHRVSRLFELDGLGERTTAVPVEQRKGGRVRRHASMAMLTTIVRLGLWLLRLRAARSTPRGRA